MLICSIEGVAEKGIFQGLHSKCEGRKFTKFQFYTPALVAFTGIEELTGMFEGTLVTKLWLKPIPIEVELEVEEEIVVVVEVTDEETPGEKVEAIE